MRQASNVMKYEADIFKADNDHENIPDSKKYVGEYLIRNRIDYKKLKKIYMTE